MFDSAEDILSGLKPAELAETGAGVSSWHWFLSPSTLLPRVRRVGIALQISHEWQGGVS